MTPSFPIIGHFSKTLLPPPLVTSILCHLPSRTTTLWRFCFCAVGAFLPQLLCPPAPQPLNWQDNHTWVTGIRGTFCPGSSYKLHPWADTLAGVLRGSSGSRPVHQHRKLFSGAWSSSPCAASWWSWLCGCAVSPSLCCSLALVLHCILPTYLPTCH